MSNVLPKCPLCDHKPLMYTKVLKRKQSETQEADHTHIYICEMCPFVGVEYFEDKDIQALKKYLKS